MRNRTDAERRAKLARLTRELGLTASAPQGLVALRLVRAAQRQGRKPSPALLAAALGRTERADARRDHVTRRVVGLD